MGRLLNDMLLKNRSGEQEELDSLELSKDTLRVILSQLSWLNRWLGNNRIVNNSVKRLFKGNPDIISETVHIIDLASGGGDVSRSLSRTLSRDNIAHRITGIEINPDSIAYANSQKIVGSPISHIEADIMAGGFSPPPCDILISTQFVYHFSDDELSSFLNRIKGRVRHAIIFIELRRSWIAHTLFGLVRFTPFHRIIRQDGKKAIRRAFSKNDWIDILDKVKGISYAIEPKFPFRYEVQIFPNA